MTIRFRVLGAATAAVLWLACGDQTADAPEATTRSAPAAAPAPSASAPASGGEDAAVAARQIFDTRCVTCHGAQGAGDGPGSKALSPPPRDFRDAAWQASVTDDHLQKIILYGGAAVGRSPAMPGNPDLTARPEVVAALVAHLRSLSSQ